MQEGLCEGYRALHAPICLLVHEHFYPADTVVTCARTHLHNPQTTLHYQCFRLPDGSLVRSPVLGDSGYVEWMRTMEASCGRLYVLEILPRSSSSNSSLVRYTLCGATAADLRSVFGGFQLETVDGATALQLERFLQQM